MGQEGVTLTVAAQPWHRQAGSRTVHGSRWCSLERGNSALFVYILPTWLEGTQFLSPGVIFWEAAVLSGE